MAKRNRQIQNDILTPSDGDDIWLIVIGFFAIVAVFIALRYRTESIEVVPTPTPTATPTATMTPTNTPTNTPTPTNSPTPVVVSTLEVKEVACDDYGSGLISPPEDEVEYMAKVIHGEAGICDKLQKSAVAWCVLNRVDWFEYPNTVIEVITQPSQFHGYTPDKVPTAEDYEIAWDVLYRWYNDLDGRTLPKEYLFFHSDHKGKNVFTTNHRKGDVWDFSLPNVYE